MHNWFLGDIGIFGRRKMTIDELWFVVSKLVEFHCFQGDLGVMTSTGTSGGFWTVCVCVSFLPVSSGK